MLQFYDQASPDIITDLYTHFVIIDKNLFLQVIRENLPLFKYVLGSKITPESLLASMTTSNQTFSTVLRGDRALMGIALGFGTENSIAHKRLEGVEEAAERDVDIPPFQNKSALITEEHFKKELLLSFPEEKFVAKDREMVIPNFGYRTIQEELTELKDSFAVPSENLYCQDPRFVFGYLKADPSNQIKIRELEKTQLQICELLAKKTFLADVLTMLTETPWTVKTPQKYQLKIDPKLFAEIDKIISKYIWNTTYEFHPEQISAFLEGFSTEREESIDYVGMDYPEYKECLDIARNNLRDADKLFSILDKDPTMHVVVPSKLYYKQITAGTGKQLQNESEVVIRYQFFDPKNRLLAESDPNSDGVLVSLNTTLPAFYHAVKGMQVGESREIFIHPSIGYGVYTMLDKGISIRGTVTLVAIQKGKIMEEPPLTSQDLSIVNDAEFESLVRHQNNQAAKCRGMMMRCFFVKNPSVNMGKISGYLKQYQSNSLSKQSISDEEQDAINRLFWNQYFGDESHSM
jgi:hypothetical protein